MLEEEEGGSQTLCLFLWHENPVGQTGFGRTVRSSQSSQHLPPPQSLRQPGGADHFSAASAADSVSKPPRQPPSFSRLQWPPRQSSPTLWTVPPWCSRS